MPHYPLDYRVKDFLRRQIAWAQDVLQELDAFCTAANDADMDVHLDRQQRRERESAAMQKEYRGLVREWKAAEEIPPEVKSEIERLSSEAEALVEEVRAAYLRADTEAARRRTVNQKATSDLRRGRRSVNIYRPGDPARAGFVDRKA